MVHHDVLLLHLQHFPEDLYQLYHFAISIALHMNVAFSLDEAYFHKQLNPN